MIGDRKTNGGLHSDRNIKPSFSDSTSTGIKELVGSDLRKNIHVIHILETLGRFEGNKRKKFLTSSHPHVFVIQSLSCVQLFAIPWTAAHQASPSFTIPWNLFKFMSIESVTLSNHLILCCPLLLLPSIFPSIRVFSNESALRIRWPKYWSFSFSISPSNEYSGFISFRINWFDLLEVQGTLKSLL